MWSIQLKKVNYSRLEEVYVMRVIRRIVNMDIRRMFTSWSFFAGILIVIMGGIISYSRNTELFGLNNLEKVGTLNIFIFSNIVSNVVMSILAPLVAALGFSLSTFDDIKTGFMNNVIINTNPKKYLFARIISTAFSGAIVFLISYVLFFLVSYIIDCSASVRVGFRFGLFLKIYDKSLFLYCIVFILHSMLFGSIFSLFGMGIALNVRNKNMVLILPLICYYLPSYIVSIFPQKVVQILTYFIPFLTFEISTLDIELYKHFSQLGFVLLIALLLIFIGYTKWRNFNRNE